MSGEAVGPEALRVRIDAIEEAYEYLLAYAAQGRAGDEPGLPLRSLLERAAAALDGMGEVVLALAEAGALQPAAPARDLAALVGEDARRALVLVRLVLAQASIGSQLVDNLNASIHIRALLTDLFVADELLKRSGTA